MFKFSKDLRGELVKAKFKIGFICAGCAQLGQIARVMGQPPPEPFVVFSMDGFWPEIIVPSIGLRVSNVGVDVDEQLTRNSIFVTFKMADVQYDVANHVWDVRFSPVLFRPITEGPERAALAAAVMKQHGWVVDPEYKKWEKAWEKHCTDAAHSGKL